MFRDFVNRFHRIQFFRRSPRTFPVRNQSPEGNYYSSDLRRCTFLVGYRKRASKWRAWEGLLSNCPSEFNGAEAVGKVLSRQTFPRRKVDLSAFALLCTLLTFFRFVSPEIAQKYDLELPEYDGIDQIVELDPKTGQKLKLWFGGVLLSISTFPLNDIIWLCSWTPESYWYHCISSCVVSSSWQILITFPVSFNEPLVRGHV